MSTPLETVQRTSGRLDGRRILVTGAASGMGRAIAELFAAEGARLALFDMQAEPLAVIAAATGASVARPRPSAFPVIGERAEVPAVSEG